MSQRIQREERKLINKRTRYIITILLFAALCLPWISLDSKAASNNNYTTSLTQAGELVRQAMEKRQESLTVRYICSENDYKVVAQNVIYAGMKHNKKAVDGDYLFYHYKGYSCEAICSVSKGRYYYTLKYQLSYMDTEAQQKEINTKVKAIINSLKLTGKSDHDKIVAIYDYLVKNVTYDSQAAEHAEKTGNYSDYEYAWTAYGALVKKKCVCRGYALAFYRLLLEAGIDNRIISGYAGPANTDNYNRNHMWNIVLCDKVYYNMDVTWDAVAYGASLVNGSSSYKNQYLLKGENSSFTKRVDGGFVHVRVDSNFVQPTSAAFYGAYPMSEHDYGETEHVHIYTTTSQVNATYTHSGNTQYQCIYCGDIVQHSIAKLVLGKPTNLKFLSGKKQMTVSYKRATGATGIQIRYAFNKAMKRSLSKYITSNRCVIKKMKSGKTYYVQARSYKKVGKKTVYSGWSAVKAIRIK